MALRHPIQYARILLDLTKDMDEKVTQAAIAQYVEFLYRDGAIKKVKYIVREFEKLAKEAEGIVRIEIKTAKKVSDSIITTIEKVFGDKVESIVSTDESLIGGVVVKKGNTIIDGSVKTQLNKLQTTLR